MNFSAKLSRRQVLQAITAAAAASAWSPARSAVTYPTRPIRLIVGLPAGGTPDVYARLVADKMSPLLGQPIVVDNRPGASGNIATELMIRPRPMATRCCW